MLRRRVWLWLFLFPGVFSRGDEVALARVGESWRYFKGTREASTPVTAWREAAFDDSSWLAGRSGFKSNDGSYDEATILGDMISNYGSVFFRKPFVVSDPSAVAWLILRMDYGGGFVAYLNGQEIARRNLPGVSGDAVPFDANAAVARLRGVAEDIDVSAFAGLLRPGRNILAIQAHNVSPGSLSFALIPELLANFNRGPFVQNASTNRVQIVWRTPVPATSAVEYGTASSLGNVTADATLTTNHVISLTNLAPGAQYFYRVNSAAGDQRALAPVASFRTLTASGDVSFAVLGDSGAGTVPQYQVAELIRQSAPDLVMHVGDIIYPAFVTGRVDLRCLSVYGPHMRTTPYYFMIGNHDLFSDPAGTNGDQPFLEAFFLPTNSVSGTEHYYSFDQGDVHFTVLFVPYFSQYAQFPQYKLEPGSPQYNWLTNDLAASTKPWNFLFFHVPINGSSLHRGDDTDNDGVPDRLELQQWIWPVAQRYGVQMIFNGHEHDYERFNPSNGVYNIVTGGGGVYLYTVYELDPRSALFSSRWHFTKVSVSGNSLLLQAIDNSGQIFDTLLLQRGVPNDPDLDGLGAEQELAAGTDPSKPDTDGDGLMDGWEVMRGLDPLSVVGADGAAGDPDGDGSANAQEQIAGTNPRDRASALRLGLRLETQQVVQLSWDAVVGKRYQLESSTNLSVGFLEYPGANFPRTATAIHETFEENVARSGGYPTYFRIRLVP